jgi:mRNA interferase RelE/StbE
MYKVVVSKSANKELHELPAHAVNRIISSIKKLADDPHPPGSKKLKGENDSWRIRVGDYRIIYSVNDEIRIVDVRKIGHRKDIYE